jgi:uncharacterized protein YybS (DUF2232 family)
MLLVLASIMLASLTLVTARRYGLQRAAVLALGAAGLLAISSLPLSLVGAPLVGLAAAIQVERQRAYGLVVAAMALPGLLQSLYLLLGVSQEDLPFAEQAEQLVAQIKAVGWQGEVDDAVLREMVLIGLRLQPGTEFLAALLTGVLAYRLGYLVSGPLRLSLPADVPLKLWRPWPQLFWALLAGSVLIMLDGWLESLGLNLVVVVLMLYAVQGLAVVRFYFDYVGLPGLARTLFYVIFLFMFGLSVLALTLLGLLDARFDWRRLSPARQTAPSEGDSIQ